MEIGERKLLTNGGWYVTYSRIINGKEFQFDVFTRKDDTIAGIDVYRESNKRIHAFEGYQR